MITYICANHRWNNVKMMNNTWINISVAQIRLEVCNTFSWNKIKKDDLDCKWIQHDSQITSPGLHVVVTEQEKSKKQRLISLFLMHQNTMFSVTNYAWYDHATRIITHEYIRDKHSADTISNESFDISLTIMALWYCLWMHNLHDRLKAKERKRKA